MVWFFLQCGFSPVWCGWATFSSRFCASVSQVACLRCLLHPVSPFCFCPHSLPPASSPPPLLTLVFSPAVSSVPGTAAPRYSPTKTHMHFQTDEEEEEEVKKRVCEPGRPPQPSWRTGPPFTAHLVHAAAAAVCLRDRFGSAFHTFPRFGGILFFDQFFLFVFWTSP